MDSPAYFFDLLKIILPALIVAGIIYLLFRQFLEKEQQRQLIAMRMEAAKPRCPCACKPTSVSCCFWSAFPPTTSSCA